MKTKQLVLIDLDDTLWDTKRNNQKSLYELYTALNWGQYFVSFDDFLCLYEPINHGLWAEYAEGKIDKDTLSIERLRRPLEGKEEHNRNEWLEINERFLMLMTKQRGLCPEALPVLSYLHERYQVCILSNGFGKVQHDKLRDTGLLSYVHHVVLSEDIGVNKPDRRIFDYALELCQAQANECVMIGDSWFTDITGASNAGIESIWYNPEGFSPFETQNVAPPKHTIQTLTELYTLL